ncbi:uncharacterized protein Hap1MRO34_002448 isoform 2-T5 [Clarias gariepinus]|uniref:uncharacterized protein LOC128515780 isoform X2 n=1 Tax=Clarias gariepinus TaxID=13013 RepID=UPI00234D76D3|nr:uncharacterized protein LOC128515780 isoform X2 [Clarias gariepinus]XP_053345920.1 uncharacterized protein LOC128515780 isoform X2 [Clarias gariepinus]XP_053345921.1 uncharacterized protein LOC128515780 isoform X2 [Clarias gariepinus]
MQINKTCVELHYGGRYIYSIPQEYSLVGNDCDYSWKQLDGTDLGHKSILNHSRCEDGIQHVIRCLNPSNVSRFIFNVRNITAKAHGAANMYEANTTTVSPDSAQSHTSTIIIIVVLLGFVLIVVLIGAWRFIKQRKRSRASNRNDVV